MRLRRLELHLDRATEEDDTTIRPRALRKHPRSTRSETKKEFVSGEVVRRHVATARVLKDGMVK
jgi:hypothetical protein